MELSQAEIIQKPKMQELSSLFMTHRLNVMYAPVKFHEYIPYGLELWPGHEVGRTDGRTHEWVHMWLCTMWQKSLSGY